MAHRTLKAKPADRALLDRQLFTLPELPEYRRRQANWSVSPSARRWLWVAALSLLLHGAMVVLCWFQPTNDRGLLGLDTRVSESRDEEPDAADCFVAVRGLSPRPQPAPPTPPP